MIQIIGLIMAVYCVARLIQVPLEVGQVNPRAALIGVVSIVAIGVIGLLTVVLLFSGMPSSP